MRDPSEPLCVPPAVAQGDTVVEHQPQEGKQGRRVRHLSRRPQTFSADLWVIERQKRPSSATSAEVSLFNRPTGSRRPPKLKIANGEKFIRGDSHNKGLLIVPLYFSSGALGSSKDRSVAD